MEGLKVINIKHQTSLTELDGYISLARFIP